MKCEDKMCSNEAHARVTWGPSPKQSGALCKEHIAQTWSMSRGLVTTGVLFWIQEPISGATDANRQ